MRLSARRAGLALAAIASVTVGLLVPSIAAHAATKGTVDFSKNVDGVKVQLAGEDHKITTRLFGLKLADGTNLHAYCIDLDTNAKNGAAMVEDNWENYPNPDTNFKAKPEKVNWVLHNSYPNVDDLSKLAGLAKVDSLSKEEAIAATQAAIWHYSNNAKLQDSDNNAHVTALYNYLTDDKINTGLTSQPADTLTITPDKVEGKAGEKVGPFTVTTTADQINVALANATKGTKLVNAAGTEVTTAKNGDELFVLGPEGGDAGKATINGTATAKVLTGRLFRGDNVKTQTLITAKTTETQVKASVQASWTKAVPTQTPTVTPTEVPTTPVASPTSGGNLPRTGSTVTVIIAAGAVLLAAGAGIVFFARRRKANAVA